MFSKQPVHTNALMRLGLPSTPIRSAFSSKLHGFENALESGSKPEQKHNLSVWTFENQWKWKRSPNISQAYVFEASTQSSTFIRHNVQFYRFQTFQCGHSKTHQKLVWVDTNRSMRFRWQHFWKHIYSVERVLKNNKNQIDSDGALTFYLAFA